MARLRVAMVAHARENIQSIHYPLGVMHAQLFVTSTYGEDFVENVTLCDYCGAEVKTNGKTDREDTRTRLHRTHHASGACFHALHLLPLGHGAL